MLCPERRPENLRLKCFWLISYMCCLHLEKIDLMKISLVFKGRINAQEIVSDTEASVGPRGGAACIACLIQPVENEKFLCSLELLFLLVQAKRKERLIFVSFSH